jgi:hypothetical protein
MKFAQMSGVASCLLRDSCDSAENLEDGQDGTIVPVGDATRMVDAVFVRTAGR